VFPALALNREGGGMESRVITTGEPLLFNDVSDRVRDPSGTYYDVDREGTLRKLPESGPPGTRAAMMVPVKHEGQVVGVVQVMSNDAEYSLEELELVEGVGFVNSVLLDLQGNPEPQASGISAATRRSGDSGERFERV
jgi:hypothetical protein